MEKVLPKMAHQEVRMWANPEWDELNPADDVRRRCKNNCSCFLSCIDKRTKDGCDRGSEVGTVQSERDGGKASSSEETKESGRRESCEKDFISRSYSGYALSLLGEGKCCCGLASESASSLPGSPGWPRTYWKLSATRKERESERSQISQKDFAWKTLGPWREG